jgi:hypothetical protein
MREYQVGILADYVPYTPLTARNLGKLAALEPRTLAIMHGSSFRGDGARALQSLDAALRDVFGHDRATHEGHWLSTPNRKFGDVFLR